MSRIFHYEPNLIYKLPSSSHHTILLPHLSKVGGSQDGSGVVRHLAAHGGYIWGYELKKKIKKTNYLDN